MSKGLFVTFEGGEGAGKTTLIEQLEAKLRAVNVPLIVTREPGGCPLGLGLRELLLNHCRGLSDRAELLLFLADRAQHVDEVITPALLAGKLVLCDRFSDSTVAYQGIAREMGADWVGRLCGFSAGQLEPNLTFYLDVAPAVGLKRAGSSPDRIESEAISFHERVRNGFLAIAEKSPNRVVVVDAHQSSDEVFDAVWKQLETRLVV